MNPTHMDSVYLILSFNPHRFIEASPILYANSFGWILVCPGVYGKVVLMIGTFRTKWKFQMGKSCCQVINFQTDSSLQLFSHMSTFSVQYFFPPCFPVFLLLPGRRCRCVMYVSQWCVAWLVANLTYIPVNQSFLLRSVQCTSTATV